MNKEKEKGKTAGGYSRPDNSGTSLCFGKPRGLER